MREVASTLLDVLGLLLVAFGVGAALYGLVGWAAAVASGAVVLGGAWWADRQQTGQGGGGR